MMKPHFSSASKPNSPQDPQCGKLSAAGFFLIRATLAKDKTSPLATIGIPGEILLKVNPQGSVSVDPTYFSNQLERAEIHSKLEQIFQTTEPASRHLEIKWVGPAISEGELLVPRLFTFENINISFARVLRPIGTVYYFDPAKSIFRIQKPLKVLVVDDSPAVQKVLKEILGGRPDIEIAGFAGSAEAIEPWIQKNGTPNIMTLDIHMPGMSGVEWLQKYYNKYRIPTVMITSISKEEGNEVFQALEAGAIDYIQKPSLKEIQSLKATLPDRLIGLAFAKSGPQIQNSAKINTAFQSVSSNTRKLLAIGSSTGGVEALRIIFDTFPDQIPPTVVVQHIPPVFSKTFAERLNERYAFEVKEAADGDEVRPNCVLIAPGGFHMVLKRLGDKMVVRLEETPPVNRFRPSVDVLFHSVAKEMGKDTVGVILTGMGNDGAKGLKALRDKGAYTIAQNEASCVVFGMPREAIELGGAVEVADLTEIPKLIFNAFTSQSIKRSA